MSREEVKKVLGDVIFEECARELHECIHTGDMFECAAGDLAESRGHELGLEDWTAEELAAYNTALRDIVVAALTTPKREEHNR